MESRQDIKTTNSIQLIRPKGHPRTLPAGPSSSELLPGLLALICASQLYPDLCPTHSAVSRLTSSFPHPSCLGYMSDRVKFSGSHLSPRLGATCSALGTRDCCLDYPPFLVPCSLRPPLRLLPQFPDWDEAFLLRHRDLASLAFAERWKGLMLQGANFAQQGAKGRRKPYLPPSHGEVSTACLETSCVAEHLDMPVHALGASLAAQSRAFASHPALRPFTLPSLWLSQDCTS